MSAVEAVTTRSPEETFQLGAHIGSMLEVGWVIGLVGPLGVGKTHLVKGMARGNAPHQVPEVTSPTFVLVNEYPGRVTLFHIDAYRLKSPRQLEELGLDEMISQGAVVIEWADRVSRLLPDDRLTITGRSEGETERVWEFEATGIASRRWRDAARMDFGALGPA